MLELYHWKPVSHSARVMICLHEIGVEYQSRFVDLIAFEQYSPEFMALNPMGQVPVLRVDGETLSESALINQYLAETFPDAGLAPKDPLGWYECQSWSKYIDYNLGSSVATLGCHAKLAPLLAKRERGELLAAIDAIPIPERRPAWREAAENSYGDDVIVNSERKAQLVLGRMEDVLAESDWLIGDSYSIADIDSFAMLHALAGVAPQLVNESSAPRTAAWLERITARPAVAATLALHTDVEGFAPGPEHSRWG
jgi:GSH-dependent disulfide-bond oxidoreductase